MPRSRTRSTTIPAPLDCALFAADDHGVHSELVAMDGVDGLDLSAHAKAGAEALVKDHGSAVVFTSGRRDAAQGRRCPSPGT